MESWKNIKEVPLTEEISKLTVWPEGHGKVVITVEEPGVIVSAPKSASMLPMLANVVDWLATLVNCPKSRTPLPEKVKEVVVS